MNKTKKPSNMEIGQKLRALRLKKDVSEAQVADAIGRNKSTYSRYESGSSRPSQNVVELIADYFEVDAQDIMPQEPNVIMENSCNDSNASGNINSNIVPEGMPTTFTEFVKQSIETHHQLFLLTIENQKMIMEMMKK